MTPRERWRDALRAACLLALAPGELSGAVVRARAGPVRDRWLRILAGLLGVDPALPRLPFNADIDTVCGGRDPFAAMAGHDIAADRQEGLLARASPGALVVPMAERLDAAVSAVTARALRERHLPGQARGASPLRLTVIALDETEPSEAPAAHALAATLALVVELDGVDRRTAEAADAPSLDDARARMAATTMSDESLSRLCAVAQRLGVPGLWLPMQAARAARAAAALAGFTEVGETELAVATRLVFAPRATLAQGPLPPSPEESSAADAGQPETVSPKEAGSPGTGSDDEKGPGRSSAPEESSQRGADGASDETRAQSPDEGQDVDTASDPVLERLVQTTRAAVPAGLLARLDGRGRRPLAGGARGRDGQRMRGAGAGRPAGARRGRPGGGRRLHVLETLRAALPMQRLRQRPVESGARVRILPEDLRVHRTVQRSGSVLIAVVDASGSSAVQRLGEAKGAIERLLADCYVRRDAIALIAFRGRGAQLLLAPTRSLTRARRELGRLPGGGGTPLAAGLRMALELAAQVRRDGRRPVLVLLTDGRANVGLDGEGGRERAREDALLAARAMRAGDLPALVIDTSSRAGEAALRVAEAMGGDCLALPHADSRALEAAMRAHRDRA